jgi:hypothetical protein
MDNIPTLYPDKYNWLKSKLEIDFLNIDEEIEQVQVLLQEACECAAIANEIRDTDKEQKEVVFARECAAARARLDTGGKSPTDARVGNEALLSEVYQEQCARFRQSRADAALWATVVTGLSTKSYSLGNAEGLIKSGYINQETISARRRERIRAAAPRWDPRDRQTLTSNQPSPQGQGV